MTPEAGIAIFLSGVIREALPSIRRLIGKGYRASAHWGLKFANEGRERFRLLRARQKVNLRKRLLGAELRRVGGSTKLRE